MTSDFIKSSLESIGLSSPMNSWITLHNKVQRIGLVSDVNINVDFRSRMFYFDTTSEMLYIRRMTGDLYKCTEDVPAGYVSYTIDGNVYVVKISNNAKTSTIGLFHSAVAFDKICSFYYSKQESAIQSYLDEIREG